MWALRLRRYLYILRNRYGQASKNSELYFSILHQCWRSSVFAISRDWRKQEFLVVDAEMSSLDPSTGELLSLGWVVIRGGRIHLGSAQHHLLQSNAGVGDSATIHQIRDCELKDGISDRELMELFVTAASGRVLVFHHAMLDVSFLDRLSRRLYGAPLLMPVIDTLQIEKRTLERRELPLGQNVLRLASCCSRYNLPASPAHNALTDALATAELLLAQIAHKGEDVRLGDLI
ncbi:MAG: 3'-5' exonuclease [Cellvibrionaceae bacterium]